MNEELTQKLEDLGSKKSLEFRDGTSDLQTSFIQILKKENSQVEMNIEVLVFTLHLLSSQEKKRREGEREEGGHPLIVFFLQARFTMKKLMRKSTQFSRLLLKFIKLIPPKYSKPLLGLNAGTILLTFQNYFLSFPLPSSLFPPFPLPSFSSPLVNCYFCCR